MKSQTQVVVIGGGIAGCSTIYHLTQEGITDCVLIERDELTSGTTWHSAAQVTNFGGNQTMVGLKTHSINLYHELANDPDYPINYHHATGGFRLASTQDNLDGYHHFVSMAKGMGVDFEVIDANEAQRRHPLMSKDKILGALWDPLDGDIDPAQLCQALTRRARKAGAEVERFNAVTGLTQNKDMSWTVHTEKGDILCEKVVNAGGYRCNEIAAMMGTELPVASMEHQYMLTESIPEIEALDFRLPLIRCPTDDFYQRQEKNGLLIGFYEQDCKTWGMDGIDPKFTMDLCPDDLDRVTDVMEGAFNRLPCLMEAGIHSIINGPITYTPDGLPLVGKIPGKQNAYCITGLRAGLGEGGGHGWLLAQIIAHGEACYDTWCIDPRRFTRYANQEFTALKAIEDYQNEFRFHMPHEFRPAGRPAKTTTLFDKLASQGAEFGTVNGWERALYFKPSEDFSKTHSFRFNETFEVVAAEVSNVQNNVGIMEVSGFNRYKIEGGGIFEWLDTIMCSRVSRKIGKVGLAYFLNEQGNVKGEATLANISGTCVWYGSAAASEYHDMDWLVEHLPADGSISITSLTNSHTTLVIAGPKSRDLMSKAAPRTDWSKAAFPWLQQREIRIGSAEVIAMSVSFLGELAYELHIPNEQLQLAYSLLNSATYGRQDTLGLGQFGLFATESMRLEKGYLHWKSDLITEFNPFETGLDRFIQMDKEFIGKEALLVMAKKPRCKLACFELHTKEGPAHSGDSVLVDDKVIGTVTSAGWGHRVGKNLFYAFISPELANIGNQLSVQTLGETLPATLIQFGQYDSNNTLVRA